MTWKLAYGGVAPYLEGQVPNQHNPEGRGFLILLEGTQGMPLPNLEDPLRPIRQWYDRPEPVCFAPVARGSWYRLERGVDVDTEQEKIMLKPEYYSVAHPSLVFEELESGTPVEVRGMSPEGPLSFQIPGLAMEAKIQIADRVARLPMRFDTLEIFPDEGRFAMVHRAPFRYRILPEELRSVTVYEVEGKER